jgi:hypothetical protein
MYQNATGALPEPQQLIRIGALRAVAQSGSEFDWGSNRALMPKEATEYLCPKA